MCVLARSVAVDETCGSCRGHSVSRETWLHVAETGSSGAPGVFFALVIPLPSDPSVEGRTAAVKRTAKTGLQHRAK